MSHKYYGFQKQEEDSFYTIPFLSTKTRRLRFLNGDLVGYRERNEFIIHKNPGLTIVRLNDQLINQGFHKQANTQKLMNEFLNQLLYQTNVTSNVKINYSNKQINVKQIAVASNSTIRITLSSL